jgi:hypothetical protein
MLTWRDPLKLPRKKLESGPVKRTDDEASTAYGRADHRSAAEARREAVGNMTLEVLLLGSDMPGMASVLYFNNAGPAARASCTGGATPSACSSRLSSISRPPPGPTPTPTSSVRTRAGSKTGSDLWPARSPEIATRYAVCDRASTGSKPGSKRSVHCCGESSRSGPASACTTSAWSSAGSSGFSRTAKRRARRASGSPR